MIDARHTTLLTMIAGGVLWSGAAFAQSATVLPAQAADASVDMFTRNRNTAVQQRQRSDYEARGLRAGAFTVYPKIDWAAEYNDNVYAASTGEQSDTVLKIRPELAVESNWSQNSLTAYVRGSINRYVDLETENTDEYGFGVSGRLDVTRLSRLSAGADYADTFEPRTAPNAPAAAVEPIELRTTTAFAAGAYTAGHAKVSGRADLRKFNYMDGFNAAGGVIEQDTRDRDVTSVMGRVDYAISPDAAFFVQVTGNNREYDVGTLAAPVRDSSGAEYLAGANFELSALVRGEVAVGYIQQDFDENVYSDTSKFSGRAQLEWFPTQLTTVTFAAGRTVEDAVNPGVGGYLSTATMITVDHELLRNVILNGRLTYSDEAYEGIDRTDNRFGATLGATYLVNRNIGVNIAATLMDVKSKGLDRDDDYSVNKLSISLVTQF